MLKRLRLIAICAMVSLAGACKQGGGEAVELRSETDVAGRRVTFLSGSVYDIQLASRSDIEKLPFNMETDCIQALLTGKADVLVADDDFITGEEARRLGLRLAFRGGIPFPCAFAFRKGEGGLLDSLNRFIDSLQATGELERIYGRWFRSEKPSDEPMPELGARPEGKPMVVAEATNLAPVAFPVEREWRGFEPEVMERFSRYAGRPLVVQYIPISSVVAALQAGNIDCFGGGIFVTEERQKSLDFSHSHYSAYSGYFVRDRSVKPTESFGRRLKRMVNDNLVVENRWRYITDGLWETVKISVLAILLGSLVGAGVCWMRMSRRRWVSAVAKVYIDLMRGIPMLVFLLIMFYVVFAGTGVGATAVAVVAFALNFAAYVSEMFRTAISSVGRGQTEAGLAIGFTQWQTFRHIVAPQALRAVMPVYKGEAVSLMKNTSIVGYIAIQDLTRASDMIRNRTFEAFFPLLVVTAIYFLLAWLLGKLLDRLVKQGNPRQSQTVKI